MIKKIFKKLWLIYQTKILKKNIFELKNEELRRLGMRIGRGTYIFNDMNGIAEPYLISMGDDVIIAAGTRLLTHDASAKYYLEGASDVFGRITIGNHCFIGTDAILLPGVTIADDCIIGAGSVVTKSFFNPSMVIAGNPARVICSIKELAEKNSKYSLNTWGLNSEEKRKYLMENEDKMKRKV